MLVKKNENLLIFGEDMQNEIVGRFLGTQCR